MDAITLTRNYLIRIGVIGVRLLTYEATNSRSRRSPPTSVTLATETQEQFDAFISRFNPLTLSAHLGVRATKTQTSSPPTTVYTWDLPQGVLEVKVIETSMRHVVVFTLTNAL